MTENEGPTLRQYIERLLSDHQIAHREHESAHAREHQFAKDALETAASLAKENKKDANEWRATMNDRERNFATKSELAGLADKVEDLRTAEIKRAETERLRLISDADEKRDNERRQTRQQWTVGVAVTIAAVVINLLIRLLQDGPK